MKSDETAKTENNEEHSRQKRRNSLLSFVNFFFVLALATSISMLLGFYSKEGIRPGLEEITLYMAIGGGLLLAYMITRKLRQRSRMSHDQHGGQEYVQLALSLSRPCSHAS